MDDPNFNIEEETLGFRRVVKSGIHDSILHVNLELASQFLQI
jgi:hypothetical protein